MIFIDSLVFAMETKDPYWMPRPHLNYLSWSYGFNVVAGFFAAFAGICVTLMAMILKETKDNANMPWQPKVEATKPMSHAPPPPSETSSKSYGTTSQVRWHYIYLKCLKEIFKKKIVSVSKEYETPYLQVNLDSLLFDLSI